MRFRLVFVVILLSSSLLRAQDAGSQAGQLWKAATAAFGTGDFAGAATNLKAIISTTTQSLSWMNNAVIPPAPPNRKWLEPVFFMLGAADFNAKNWPDAISTFKAYRQLFPTSSRLNQVIFFQAQAEVLNSDPQDAIPLFTDLLPLSDYHAKVLLLLVQADEDAGKRPDAIALLEKEKVSPDATPAMVGKVRLKLAMLYFNDKNSDKVASLLKEMDADAINVPNILQFNSLAAKQGDIFLFAGKVDDALRCYRYVRNKDQIATLHAQQVELLHRQREANLAFIQSNPLDSSQQQLDNRDIDSQIAKDQESFDKYQALPSVLPTLYLRIGRAYATGGRFWEAAVMYREIMRRFPSSQEAELALYGSITAFVKLKQYDRAQALCQSYLTQYPQGKYIDDIRFLRGVVAYQTEDFDNAIIYFNDSLRTQPDKVRREEIELVLGDIKLREEKYDEAVTAYRHYEQDFPVAAAENNFGKTESSMDAANYERAEYRIALALTLAGKFDDAGKALAAYLKEYPQGSFVADVEYRQDVIKFANKQYDAVIADGLAWQKKHGKSGPLAEVLSLMGDSYASKDNNDEAIKTYIASYKAAQSPDVLDYSIDAAAKLMQKGARWADIVQMFQEFVKNNPDNPMAVTAIVWIGRADIKLGKVEEAKRFMADTAKQYLNDPSREAVDEIITQLAQLYARRHSWMSAPPIAAAGTPVPATTTAAPAAIAAGSSPASPTPSATQPVPPAAVEESPDKALEDILTIPNLATQPTARARILYSKAELARLQRAYDLETQIIAKISQEFKPEDLSPVLLGKVGDYLVQASRLDQAVPYYNQLMDVYDKSPLVDYAYNGLAQIAFDQQDFQKADRYYSKALDKGLAESKLKDITLGEAQTLLKLNRPAEAKPLFEEVASTRAWRGEATALSVFSLGEIQMQLGKFPEANAYFQRVFVAYQKYPEIQAKAYLGSGEAFEKLGKIPEAINTYSEMIRNPNLSSFPEFSDAKQRLQGLVQK